MGRSLSVRVHYGIAIHMSENVRREFHVLWGVNNLGIKMDSWGDLEEEHARLADMGLRAKQVTKEISAAGKPWFFAEIESKL